MVSVDSVCDLIRIAEQFEAKELLAFCFEYASYRMRKIRETSSWKKSLSDSQRERMNKAEKKGEWKGRRYIAVAVILFESFFVSLIVFRFTEMEELSIGLAPPKTSGGFLSKLSKILP